MKTQLHRNQRGSLLLVAMLLMAAIGISIVSFLKLSQTTMKVSHRALYLSAAMNLAENGLEQGVFALNKSVASSSYSWTGNGWTVTGGGSNARQKWTGYTFDQGVTGQVQSYVYNYSGAGAPKIVAKATISMPGQGGGTTEKWVEVQLRKTSRFSNGLVAKETISFSGNNASVDSWNSMKNDDGTLRASPAPYSNAVRRDNGSVGSISVSTSAIGVGNADIWGYASTGGSLPSLGPNGIVGPFGTTSGTMDMSRVSTDFTAPFEPVELPIEYEATVGGVTQKYPVTWTNYGGAINNTETLPRASDTPLLDGKYYIKADSVDFNNKTLRISGKVVLYLTNSATAFNIGGGSGMLSIDSGASLEAYGAGDIKIAGNGILNGGTTLATANQPINCQFYGMKTSGTQNIQIAGNGVLSAVVYAPQGSIKINGNGDVCGSMVGNDITVVGNAAFHYDESLAEFGGNNPYRISKWKELTSATDRAAYAAVFTGW